MFALSAFLHACCDPGDVNYSVVDFDTDAGPSHGFFGEATSVETYHVAEHGLRLEAGSGITLHRGPRVCGRAISHFAVTLLARCLERGELRIDVGAETFLVAPPPDDDVMRLHQFDLGVLEGPGEDAGTGCASLSAPTFRAVGGVCIVDDVGLRETVIRCGD